MATAAAEEKKKQLLQGWRGCFTSCMYDILQAWHHASVLVDRDRLWCNQAGDAACKGRREVGAYMNLACCSGGRSPKILRRPAQTGCLWLYSCSTSSTFDYADIYNEALQNSINQWRSSHNKHTDAAVNMKAMLLACNSCCYGLMSLRQIVRTCW